MNIVESPPELFRRQRLNFTETAPELTSSHNTTILPTIMKLNFLCTFYTNIVQIKRSITFSNSWEETGAASSVASSSYVEIAKAKKKKEKAASQLPELSGVANLNFSR